MMAYDKRPHIGGQHVHDVSGIRFLNHENEGTSWLQVDFLDEEGFGVAHTSIFYGDGLEPEKVKAAMREYLGLPAEVKPETDSERAAREPTGLMVD